MVRKSLTQALADQLVRGQIDFGDEVDRALFGDDGVDTAGMALAQ